MEKIVIYARVSTDQQTHDSQLEEIRSYCSRRGWTEWEEIIDTASGAKVSREGLDRLMTSVRRGKIDIVIVYKLDRLARSLSHLAQILNEFQTHKTALVCPNQGIDTSNTNPAAQLQINILGAVAQFERELIVERIKSGVKAAKMRGVLLGRPSKLSKFAPFVMNLLSEGLSVRAISERLKLPISSAYQLIADERIGQRVEG